MSRFKLPPRVAPSPAAGEPGMQNAAARLRSSREAQDRLLAEQRRQGSEAGEATQLPEVQPETRKSADRQSEKTPSSAPEALVEQARNFRKEKKDKIVVMFRLPKKQVGRLSTVPMAEGLSEAYVLKAFAKEGRAALRAITSANDLSPLVATAKTFRATDVAEMTVGEAMTVYVQPAALNLMQLALGDPLMVLPKATIVGAFFAAIVIGLIEARQAKRASS
jgi:sRNA-binding protein